MPFDFSRGRLLLQTGDLGKLFVEGLGWEPSRKKLTLRISERDYAFSAIAEKRGFTVWLCESPDGQLPGHTTRLKLDRALTQTSFEHLILFTSGDRSRQSWMWVRRETGKPLSARTHEFTRGQSGDSLLQKLQILYVSLEEEENGELSTIAIAGRARAAFDIERVTRVFYRDFDTQRKAFLKFIDGIGEVADREWYASVMLNRMMFVYFIQRKGFLDADPDYLRQRLQRCQQEKGKDKFYTFYRYFLLRLFHEGFGKRRKDRAPDLEKLLGNIPYLNGGLFDVHELEKPERYGKDIQIPDKAFERIFDYFDQYQWHLDERPLRNDKEINPDVLGYIFEKYINQKQMGAYYTKEDITEYISKNTVLPFLFDDARAECKVAFENSNGPTVWDLLRDNPDRYIYPAIRHGLSWKYIPDHPAKGEPLAKPLDLPAEVAVGFDATKPNLIERRKAWNKAAPDTYALPTEIWREVIARRQRYEDVRKKLTAGEVRDINDLITLNLDIRQFAQDVIASTEGPELLRAFWHAIEKVTILDPTCGSGAFLFASLNILEPLYEACLDRMESFVADLDRSGEKHPPQKYSDFLNILERVAAHPNRHYFIFKSIILNNLFGVDIMEEAVEICKLRLFLKLASQVEPDTARDNLGIEPLPDIDFNIRAGNTLVGYATYDEVERAVTSTLDFDNAMEKISVKAADLQQTFDKFRQLQTEGDGLVPAADKQALQNRLKALEDELNRHLAGEYDVKVSDKDAYAKWVKSHQPFHWFIQFYGILHIGGFDVIIGNPPYVEYRKLEKSYRLQNGRYSTEECGNLLAFVTERSLALLARSGRSGLVLLVSTFTTERMRKLQELILRECYSSWVSNFAWRPSKLFAGCNTINSIFLGAKGKLTNQAHTYSTKYLKWTAEERDFLFPLLVYGESTQLRIPGSFPKIASTNDAAILNKISSQGSALSQLFSGVHGRNGLFYFRGMLYWIKVLDHLPVHKENGKDKISSQCKHVLIDSTIPAHSVIAIMSSSLFFWFYQTLSDCQQINQREFLGFKFNPAANTVAELDRLGRNLMKDYRHNSKVIKRHIHSRGVTVQKEYFEINQSKPILDAIDTVLARHYGFTAEELDFILNYDIKYRMGRDAEDEEEN
ncbi:MAG: SAM-dependent methyltransferase [Nitrospirae bacterium]|nr:SAM-dependent methyltransferase [Nitrospirota bacterium]